MKQYMKYVTALLFVLSLVILLFLPVITVASMDISMMDVLRLGGQAGSGSGVFAELLQRLVNSDRDLGFSGWEMWWKSIYFRSFAGRSVMWQS